VFKFLFYSSSVLFLYSKICISIYVLFIRVLHILYSFSSSCLGSLSLMKAMMGLRMRLNLMSQSRRVGHADLKC